MSAGFNPTAEQDAILSTSASALVVAGPGTGKTRTAIEKALRYSEALDSDTHKRVLFLSFSNAAVFRLADAAKIHISRSQRRRLRFSTYHALATDILRCFGRYSGLPPKIRVMDRLEEMIVALENEWPDGDAHTSERLDKAARGNGLIGFSNMIPLACSLLESNSKLRRIFGRKYPLIIADEFQDTSAVQWRLLRAIGDESQVIAFGDPNQIIYAGLHAATADRIEEFKTWKGISQSKFSTRNFRCGNSTILDFAEALLTGSPHSVKKGSGVQLVDVQYRKRLRMRLAGFWQAIRARAGDSQTICFLAPSNQIADGIATELRNPPQSSEVNFPVYAKIARDEAAFDAIFLALCALRDMAVFEDEASLKRAAVAVLALDLSWNKRKKRTRRKLEDMVTRLRESLDSGGKLTRLVAELRTARSLEAYAQRLVQALADIPDLKTSCKSLQAHGDFRIERVADIDPQLPLFESVRAQRQPRGLQGFDAVDATTHVVNYHRAKGREFDYVAMIVDPRGESAKSDIDELRRLYYVCATRARQWLGVLYYGSEKGRVLGPVIK